MKHILGFMGVTAVAAVAFVAGIIGSVYAYAKDGSVCRGTELGDKTNDLRDALKKLKE